ncbi:Uncharacterised protein [Shigella sonnei]|nr:Uncharacterised protein [Shigella sonnei]
MQSVLRPPSRRIRLRLQPPRLIILAAGDAPVGMLLLHHPLQATLAFRVQHLPPVQAVRDDYPALSVLKAVVQPLRVDLLRHPTGIIIPVAQRHPPRQVTLPPPYPFSRPAAQRVIEVPALHLWFAVLYPRVEHQAVLAVVVIVVGALVVHPDNPFRDTVRLLRQPAVFIVAIDIVRIFRDAVIRPRREGAVRVQFRVRQPISCRVCCIRDIDIQVRCRGVDARQPPRVAVTVLPALLRATDAD